MRPGSKLLLTMSDSKLKEFRITKCPEENTSVQAIVSRRCTAVHGGNKVVEMLVCQYDHVLPVCVFDRLQTLWCEYMLWMLGNHLGADGRFADVCETAALLEGSRGTANVAVTVELVRTLDGSCLWCEDFDLMNLGSSDPTFQDLRLVVLLLFTQREELVPNVALRFVTFASSNSLQRLADQRDMIDERSHSLLVRSFRVEVVVEVGLADAEEGRPAL